MEFRDGTNVEDGGQPDDGDTGNETGSDHSSDLYHSAAEDRDGNNDDDDYDRGDDAALVQQQVDEERQRRATTRAAWEEYKARRFVNANDEDFVDGRVDEQGVPWRALLKDRRETLDDRLERFRELESYSGYYDGNDGRTAKDVDPATLLQQCYYKFDTAALWEKGTIAHSQLRHMTAVTSKQDVFYIAPRAIKHYCPVTRESSVLIDMGGATRDAERTKIDSGQRMAPFIPPFTATTLCAYENLVMVGGAMGQFVCYDRNSNSLVANTTLAVNDITNALTVDEGIDGGVNLLASCNDSSVRVLDIQTLRQKQHIHLPWPVNYAKQSPDRRMICAAGDDKDKSLMLDARTGAPSIELHGQRDHAFSCSFSPDGFHLAIGVQDRTCRVFDMRNTGQLFQTLDAIAFPVRSVNYSSCGRFLAVAEECDYVRIYKTADDYASSQLIETVGEIAGVAFQPDSHQLYISNGDPGIGCLLQYSEQTALYSLESLLF